MSRKEHAIITCSAIVVSGAAALAAWNAPALAQNLPAGNGKEMVEMICQGCHDLSPITTSIGFSRADWETVVKSMIDMGADIKPDQATVIVNYLTDKFPPKK
jgi:virginiamycin B lyase